MQTYAPVLATRILPRSRVTTAILVVAFAALTAVAAQWVIPLPFTPVPITGQTLAVLLTGAVLGAKPGAASQLLYVGVGALGLPVYAGGGGGWETFTGATFGYLVGFIVAAYAIGYLAEKRQDRSLATAWPAFLAGSIIIYGFGVSWLIASVGMSYPDAMAAGVVPFVVGDLIKAIAAGTLLPALWKVVGDR